MSVGRFVLTTSYTYLIFCEEDDITYVKVGFSFTPLKRLTSICNGVPFRPTRMALLDMGSEQQARYAEAAILSACSHWSSSGEWLKIHRDQFHDFLNTICLATHSLERGGVKRSWSQINVVEYRKQQRAKQRYARLYSLNRLRRYGITERDARTAFK